MAQNIELVGKIGSMALIRRDDNDIDYNIFSRLGQDLRPGMIWVSSGATEIGRLDYMKRNNGRMPRGDAEEVKADFAAQGQAVLMENYRRFIDQRYSVRQILVEHTHFNDDAKRECIRSLFLRAAEQNAVPIVNYNDPVSDEENRKMELSQMRARRHSEVVECIDNDETASVVARLVKARLLVIMTSTEGIYQDPADPSTLVEEVYASEPEAVVRKIRALQAQCVGASRAGAGGARAKLEYMIEPVLQGTTVVIGHARHRLRDLANGKVRCTRIGIRP